MFVRQMWPSYVSSACCLEFRCLLREPRHNTTQPHDFTKEFTRLSSFGPKRLRSPRTVFETEHSLLAIPIIIKSWQSVTMASTTSSPSSPSAPLEEDDTAADLPLTMAASVVLESLPKDAHSALQKAGELENKDGSVKDKGISSPRLASSTVV